MDGCFGYQVCIYIKLNADIDPNLKALVIFQVSKIYQTPWIFALANLFFAKDVLVHSFLVPIFQVMNFGGDDKPKSRSNKNPATNLTIGAEMVFSREKTVCPQE